MSSRVSIGEPKESRTIEEICKGAYAKELVGIQYCMLKPTEKVNCYYRAKKPDHNGLYECVHCQETDKDLS